MNIWLLSFDTGLITSEAALSNIRESSLVKLAQFNHFFTLRDNFPDDPHFEEQWALHNTGQTGGKPDADLDAPEAWNITTGGTTSLGDEIVIAIIDNGFDLEHEDLDFWKNVNEIPNNGIDDDNNGYIDDYDGWNAYESNGNIPSDFGVTHGTAVTGVAGAKGDNGKGISGISWNVKIMPIAGATELENVAIEAYGYALKMRLDYNNTGGLKGALVVVTNSSFGVEEQFPSNYPLWCAMYDEMGAEGILSSAAAPNNNKNVDEVGDIPCGCSSEYLITVANTDHNDQKYPSSGYGPTTIDLGAPGTSIISTAPNNLYHYQLGTSFASPHVAGTVALMFAAADADLISNYKNNPATVALQFKQWLLRGIDPISSLQGITLTGGRLNSLKALAETVPGIPFYFINRIQNTEDFGSLIIDNELSGPVQSGDYRSFEEGTNHIVRTDELPFLPNWMGGGTTEKYHRWYQVNSDFSLNHTFFADLSTPAQQKAYFRSTECATIQTQLLSGGLGGEVEIRDPWRYYQDVNGNWLQSVHTCHLYHHLLLKTMIYQLTVACFWIR